MSSCPTLGADGTSGISAALRVVDCASAEAAQTAFGRLFAPGGGLGTPLTILLTLYVAMLGLSMLTGRSRIGLNMLTPRMLGLGLVLTFATSWVAYQNVVWTLLTAGPDQIASILTGQSGSATAAFGARLDTLFSAVASAAEASANAPPAEPTATGITPAPPQAGGWTPADVLWMAALLLLLGTVGVLLVARIALAVLLAVGPIFIVFALFRGSHGLFVGWLKGAVMFALVPLFTVLVGGAALALLAPIVVQLQGPALTMEPAVTMFLGACVYVALMVMVLRVSSTMVSGWRLGSRRDEGRDSGRGSAAPVVHAPSAPEALAAAAAGGSSRSSPDAPARSSDERIRHIISGAQAPANDTAAPAARDGRVARIAAAQVRYPLRSANISPARTDGRVQTLGASLRAPAAVPAGKAKS